MPTGLKSFQEEQKKKQDEFTASRDLRLSEKNHASMAKIRFLTDMDDMGWAYFHTLPGMTRLGKRFNKSVYCLMQDGAECPLDEDSETAPVKRKFFFWIYVYDVFHTEIDADKKWTKLEFEGDTYYVEPVNSLMLLVTGPGMKNSIITKFEKWAKKFKTITDRDYMWSRTGTNLDTVYDLNPCDEGKNKLPEEVDKAAEECTPLDEVMRKLTATKAEIMRATKGASAGKVEKATEKESSEPEDEEELPF